MTKFNFASYFILAFAFGLHLMFITPSSAQQVVHVKGDQVGQGILRQANGECYLISPEHVIGFASEVTITNARRLKEIATAEAVYPPDLSISRLSIATSCTSQWSSSRWIKKSIPSIEEAAIIMRQADGSLKRYFVVVTEYDDIWIKVRPKYNNESLFQGLSGSALTSGGRLLGQLMSIYSDNNVGSVLRQDIIDGLLKNRFGEGQIDYGGINLEENILSPKWIEYGENLIKNSIVIKEKSIILRYSGTGDGNVNVGIRQNIDLNTLEKLKLSFIAKASALILENSYVSISLSLFDKTGKRMATIYTSPDRFMMMDKPSTFVNWKQGKILWDIEKILRNYNQIQISHIGVDIFIKAQNTHRCTGCSLELKDLKLFY